MSETINPPEFPTVDRDALKTLQQLYEFDPGAGDVLMHELVEEDQHFAEQITAEGYRLSGGSIERQAGFIDGAKFARAAIKRTLALRYGEEVDTDKLIGWLFEAPISPDETAEEPGLRGYGEALD